MRANQNETRINEFYFQMIKLNSRIAEFISKISELKSLIDFFQTYKENPYIGKNFNLKLYTKFYNNYKSYVSYYKEFLDDLNKFKSDLSEFKTSLSQFLQQNNLNKNLLDESLSKLDELKYFLKIKTPNLQLASICPAKKVDLVY